MSSSGSVVVPSCIMIARVSSSVYASYWLALRVYKTALSLCFLSFMTSYIGGNCSCRDKWHMLCLEFDCLRRGRPPGPSKPRKSDTKVPWKEVACRLSLASRCLPGLGAASCLGEAAVLNPVNQNADWHRGM